MLDSSIGNCKVLAVKYWKMKPMSCFQPLFPRRVNAVFRKNTIFHSRGNNIHCPMKGLASANGLLA